MTAVHVWVAFLNARLSEDEADAGDIPTDVEWYARFQPVAHRGRAHEFAVRRIASRERLLREVAAKREILAEHRPMAVGSSLIWCARCHRIIEDAREDEEYYGPFDWPCPTVHRGVIAVYSNHPDYPKDE